MLSSTYKGNRASLMDKKIRKGRESGMELIPGTSDLLTTTKIGSLILLLGGSLGVAPTPSLCISPCMLWAHTWTELRVELLKGRRLGLGDYTRRYHTAILGIWACLAVRVILSLLLALCKDGVLNHLTTDALLDFLLLPLASFDGSY